MVPEIGSALLQCRALVGRTRALWPRLHAQRAQPDTSPWRPLKSARRFPVVGVELATPRTPASSLAHLQRTVTGVRQIAKLAPMGSSALL